MINNNQEHFYDTTSRFLANLWLGIISKAFSSVTQCPKGFSSLTPLIVTLSLSRGAINTSPSPSRERVADPLHRLDPITIDWRWETDPSEWEHGPVNMNSPRHWPRLLREISISSYCIKLITTGPRGEKLRRLFIAFKGGFWHLLLLIANSWSWFMLCSSRQCLKWSPDDVDVSWVLATAAVEDIRNAIHLVLEEIWILDTNRRLWKVTIRVLKRYSHRGLKNAAS